LLMLGLYALLIHLDVHVNTVIVLFGGFVAVTMALVMVRYRYNKTHYPIDQLIGEEKSGGHH
ncbi:MAG: lysophospholipid transporter LplT, partial [Burkholderiaceae bacterium]